jgi:hypothetical protein
VPGLRWLLHPPSLAERGEMRAPYRILVDAPGAQVWTLAWFAS